MFRITCMVEDKKLAQVMYALTGLVLDLSAVPVANVTVEKGGVKAKTSGSTLDMFAAWLKGKAGFTAKDVRGFCVSHGLKESSATYVIQQAREAGLLNRRGKGSATVWRPKGG